MAKDETRKKTKGPAPRTTTLEALLDAHGDHRAEALHGRPAQAVARATALLRTTPPPHHEAKAVAHTALALARAGHADAVRALVDLVLAVPRPDWPDAARVASWEAAVRAPLAVALHELGDAAGARSRLDEALALAPGWTAPPAGPYAPSPADPDEMCLAGELLLALGRDGEAAAIFANVPGMANDAALQAAARAGDARRLEIVAGPARPGQLGAAERTVDTLLAHGHLDLFDAALPAVLASPLVSQAQKLRLPLARTLAAGTAAFDRAFVALAAGTEPELDAARLEALATELPKRAALGGEGREALVAALRATLARTAPRLVDWVQTWRAVRALVDLGEGVAAELDRASTPMARAQAVAVLLPTAPLALRAPLVGLAERMDPEAFGTPVGAVQRQAVRALLRAHERELGVRLLLADAEASRSSGDALGELAAAALEIGDHETAWTVLALASKARKEAAVRSLRMALAGLGLVDAWWTALQLVPGPTEAEMHWELGTLVQRTHAG